MTLNPMDIVLKTTIAVIGYRNLQCTLKEGGGTYKNLVDMNDGANYL